MARIVCLTLAGLLKQAELRQAETETERALLACSDGLRVYELGRALEADFPTLAPLVQALLDRRWIELVPEDALEGLAPAFGSGELAPALANSPAEPAPFQAPAPPTFEYPARSPVPPPQRPYKKWLSRR
jgi:hypothetical protein